MKRLFRKKWPFLNALFRAFFREKRAKKQSSSYAEGEKSLDKITSDVKNSDSLPTTLKTKEEHPKWTKIVYHTHIVFAIKHARQMVYGRMRDDAVEILRILCDRNNRSRTMHRPYTHVSVFPVIFYCSRW